MSDEKVKVAVIEAELNHIKNDIGEIKKDIKELVSLKFKIMGGVIAVSALISLIGKAL